MNGNRLAIVGIAFRFPGPAGDGFWQALCEGRDLVGTVHESRWARETYLHPRQSEPGRSYTFAAGSLGDISGFDAAFFGISPREAAQMDPQQRVLLELTWQALESGGIRPSDLRGSGSGVFIGFSGSDYLYRHADDLASLDQFVMTGCTASVAANRISYFFDLRGPSMAIDTACSSALVAFHQACRSVQTGECGLAITGAINLNLHPLPFIAFSKASMLSKRGICSAFDAAGDGYVRSEGGAIVVLKKLADAIADGNRVYAVVAGSAVNCDGRTNGITVPSAEAQAALLTDVYAKAGIDPGEVDYVEAHGTGTAVGDPIEARALGEALGMTRPAGKPLRIGSVKSNVGHMEAAAGMAGLVKALYCLQHRSVPRSINFETPNPRIPFADWNLEVVRQQQPLDNDKTLVIGVNSFGFGGANAHVILESAPTALQDASPRLDFAAPLIVSGRSEAALKAASREMANCIRTQQDLALYDIARSAALHRDWHEYRAIAHGGDRSAAANALASFAETNDSSGLAIGRVLAHASGPVFVYSGNGSQWVGMGRRLLEEDAVFRSAVSEVDRLVLRHWKRSILEMLRVDDLAELLQATEIAQPLLFAVQIGITKMLGAWGIAPTATTGHSVGEIAAAWASGALTLEQAVEVVFHRSAWQGTTRGAGAMTAVRMGERDMLALLESFEAGARLTVAAINSPRSVTVAGALPDLHALESVLRERDTGCTRLALDYAFHSPAMDAIEQGVTGSLGILKPRATQVPFYSAVAGVALAGEALDGAYWWRNIREPVCFDRAIQRLRESGASVFLEIGPRPVLGAYLAESLGETARDCRILSTVAPSSDGADALRKRAFEVLIAGCRTDLAKLFPVAAPYVDVPGYAWQREPHWYEPTSEGSGLLQRRAQHPLLGYRLGRGGIEWENQIDADRFPAFADHRVGNEIVFPAAGFAELALAACAELHGGTVREFEELNIHAALILDDQHSKTLRLSVDADDGRFTVRSRNTAGEESWRIHATGRLPLQAAGAPQCDPCEVPSSRRAIPAEEHYRLLAEAGLNYGPAFRAVAEAWTDGKGVAAVLNSPTPLLGDAVRAELEPCALDACFQLLLHLRHDDSAGGEGIAFVPVRIGHLTLVRPRTVVKYVRLAEIHRGPRSVVAHCALYGEDREPVAMLREVRFRAVPLRDSGVTGLRSYAIPKPVAGRKIKAAVPATERLRAACAARLHADARLSARRRYYAVVEPLLEAMLCAFAQGALRELQGADADPETIHWRLERLRRLAGDVDLPEAAEIWTELLGDHPDHSTEILRLGRIGLRFADLARGTTSLESLLQGHADSTLQNWSAQAVAESADFAEALASLVTVSLESLPKGERLRILLVDAGSAETSGRVLATLDPDRADCVIACRDPATREELAGSHPRRPGCTILCVDLAQIPARLPAELVEPFDIVLLDGRAASERDAFLRSVRLLTADGGLLAVFEPSPTRATALAAEILFHEPEPVRDTWQRALARNGFLPQALIEDIPGEQAGPRLILSRAEANTSASADSEAPAAKVPGVWLLAADAAGDSAELARRLAVELLRCGRAVEVVTRDFEAAPAWAELLAAARARHGEVAGVVELSGLRAHEQSRAPRDIVERQIARCESLGALFEACNGLDAAPACWLITAEAATALLPADIRESLGEAIDAGDAPVWGYVRTAMNEYPRLALRLVDLAAPDSVRTMAASLADALLHPDAEDETILTPAGRFAVRVDAGPLARFARKGAAGERSTVRLEMAAPGQLKHLSWVRHSLPAIGDDEVEIEVRAAGLNFRDVMFAMGQLGDEALETGFAGPTLGMEVAGTVAAAGNGVRNLLPGDRVIAFAASGFGTRVVTKASSVINMPAEWSFEAGATVPTTFLTAHYCLNHLARLAEGERILIHGAAGGVGIAAIQIARLAGAEIFASVGSEAKRDFMQLLGVDHVLNSRTLDFAGEVLARTGGQGVDVVLNSLAGEAMVRSLQIVKPLGRFLELGKRDFYENTRVGLRPFRNNIAYFGIDADQLMRERPAFVRRLMLDLLGLFEEGSLKPLPYRAFAAADAVEAFRYMQQSRHIGKVVLRMEPAPRAESAAPVRRPGLRLPANATYLVTGGLSGLGLRSAQWLAEKGARHLVLAGRRGVPDEQAASVLAALAAGGIQVSAERCDVADYAALQQLLGRIRAGMPPLRGIVHAAGVIRDGLIRNLGREHLAEVFAPKVLGALNLHRLTRDLPLDFFVLYSSATTTFGNLGQANYVAANRFLEVLADARRAKGLPALCVSWGPIEDVGFLARNREIRDRLLARMGDAAISSAQALAALEHLLLDDVSGLAVMKASRSGLGRLAATSRSAKFQLLAAQAGEAAPAAADSADLERWLAELDDPALAVLFTDLLKQEVAEILRMPAEKLDADQPLQDLGLDSLMGVELMTAVEARFGVSIPVLAVAEIGTIERLVARLIKELRRGTDVEAHDHAAAINEHAHRLAAQHSSELSKDEVDAVAAELHRRTADGAGLGAK